jgi:hypothetical protein
MDDVAKALAAVKAMPARDRKLIAYFAAQGEQLKVREQQARRSGDAKTLAEVQAIWKMPARHFFARGNQVSPFIARVTISRGPRRRESRVVRRRARAPSRSRSRSRSSSDPPLARRAA